MLANQFVLHKLCWFWREFDRWLHLRKHLGRNESNYFLYQSGGPVRSPGGLYAEPHPPSLLKLVHLLHLNQACVQDLISNLTTNLSILLLHKTCRLNP